MDHLQSYNSELHDELREKPAELMPLFERAAKQVYQGMLVGARAEFNDLSDIQVVLTSTCKPTGMRELTAKDYSKLTTVQGVCTCECAHACAWCPCRPNPVPRRIQFAVCVVQVRHMLSTAGDCPLRSFTRSLAWPCALSSPARCLCRDCHFRIKTAHQGYYGATPVQGTSPSTLNPQPLTLSPQPSTLDPQPPQPSTFKYGATPGQGTLPETLNLQTKTLDPRP